MLEFAKTKFFLTLGAVLLSTLCYSFQAHSRATILDRSMLSLHPQAQIEGPIFDYHGDRQAYGDYFFSILINEAHEQASRYLKQGDTQGYYAFMLLALTVPLHEGLYVQFRTVDNTPGLCQESLNNGTRLQNEIAREFFQQTFLEVNSHNKEVPYAVSCDQLIEEKRINQLISGGTDGSDISVMQVNVRWHYDNFLGRGDYRSVERSIRYGLAYLMRGFRPVYANYENYHCLIEDKSDINYEGLIRGTWAGQYNSGNITRTCRFADSSSPYTERDMGFKNNLEKVYEIANGGMIGFNRQLELKVSYEVRAALEEIIVNFLNQSNDRDAIEQILES